MRVESYETKLAKLILKYSLNIVKDDIVLIKSETIGEPLVREFVKEIIILGAHPIVRFHIPEHKEYLVKYGKESQLTFLPYFELQQTEAITAYIYIDCLSNARSLSRSDPKKLAMIQRTGIKLREIMNKREAEGKFRWSICPYPTNSMAQDADMSFTDYSDFVFEACKLNDANPVLSWKKVEAEQKKIVKKLTGSKELLIVGKDTELKLSVKDRLWINCCGHRNMPDGEVFTSPIETSANGEILFDIPTTYNGVEAEDVRLTFKDGVIVKSSAKKGEKFLKKMIEMDEGSNKVGEIAFGLNDCIKDASKNILFDEKIGRSMHLAIGSSYEEALGKNKSALHWDLIKDMRKGSKVYIDGKMIYKDGKFI